MLNRLDAAMLWRWSPFLLIPVIPFARNLVVGVLTITALLSLGLPGFAATWRDLRRSPLALLFGVLSIWAAVTLIWAPVPWSANWLKTVALTLAGLLTLAGVRALTPGDVGVVARNLCIAMGLAAVLFGIDLITRGGISGPFRQLKEFPWEVWVQVSRGAPILLLLAFPTAALLWLRVSRLAAIGWVVLVAVLLAQQPMRAALLAFVGGGVLALIALVVGPRLRRWLLALGFGLLSLYVLLAPLLHRMVRPDLVLERIPNMDASWLHRIGIWWFSAELAGAHPLGGMGFDAARRIGGEGYRIWLGHLALTPPMPLHSHNAALQIALELGVPGSLLTAGILMAIGWMVIRTRERLTVAVQLAVMIIFLVIAHLSFGIWQEWWLATVWLAAAYALVVGRLIEGNEKDVALINANSTPNV